MIGQAYELTREVREEQSKPGWNERVLIVQSEAFAEAAASSHQIARKNDQGTSDFECPLAALLRLS